MIRLPRITRLPSRVGLLVVIGSLTLMALEIGARVIWRQQYRQRLERCLHAFEHVDRERDVIVLNPGARLTVREYMSDLALRQRIRGSMLMEDFLREHPQPDSATMISINAHGFRGPEITLPKPPSRFRIMTIGDSCTWGLGVSDDCSYPRVLEQELNRQVAADCGLTVEVVNGGFCAYGFERALLRVGEYLATEPDLITIYLGWNRTIFRADPRRSPQLYHKYALYRFFYHALINRSQGGSRWLDERGEYYDPADESLEPFRHHCFEHDLRDLDRLVTAIRDHDSRIRILLVTLAGMLDRAVEPDAAALAMVGPLEISDNLYLYPLLTARFNQALRQYARRRDLPVLDLERHARGHFIPRSAYFLDPVHPSAAGYAAIGRFMASELLGYLPCH